MPRAERHWHRLPHVRHADPVRRLLACLALVTVACGGTTASTTTTSTTTTSTSTTTTTTILLPDAPLADQLYVFTNAQLQSLFRNFLELGCDDWTLVENGADRGACLAGGVEVVRYEAFPGSVRLQADRGLYETEWRSMYADAAICDEHDGDHAAVAHNWIVFSSDRSPIDTIVSSTGAVYLAPPNC